ncbi:MAG TPA: hypothetical protein QGF95_09895 [Candidatus Latescibacteria bacterium]|nr:hypothetical protein [Candidatus Latescibacterota bacterium]HJP30853.1 hypothetical protein [Candidatus Latescibacterota bacterium]
MSRTFRRLIIPAFTAFGVVTVHGQDVGHRIASTQVVIDQANHWNNWAFPAGTLEFSASGAVAPGRLNNNINASLDILDYFRLHPPPDSDKEPEEFTILDAIKAGSNTAQVANILDGDPETYWEPEPLTQDLPVTDQWWFSVDLGRYMIADQIVLKFAEGADPFLLFDVLVSNGLKPQGITNATDPTYVPVLRRFTPNKNQREFVIELPSEDEAPGRGLRFVQVIATGTDSSRAEHVSQVEYDRLLIEEPDLAGMVEYYKKQADGRQILVGQVVYDQLDESSRGQVLYFRRERPRVAELEVWTLGDEILMGTAERGGTIDDSDGNIVKSALANGDVVALAPVLENAAVPPFSAEGFMAFDLGAFFWVDRQWTLYARTGNFNRFDNYRLEFSDGELAADGSIRWEAAVTRGLNPEFQFQPGHDYNEFEAIKARHFRFIFERLTFNSGGAPPVNIAEMQLFGRGHLPEVSLESDLIRLGSSRNLLSIEWDADTPPGTEVVLQTRTGNELDIIRRYYKQLNPALPRTEVTETAYEALRESWKAGIDEEERLGSDWSAWSEPYRLSAGSAITSPSPRQFVKIQATLLSDDPEKHATLNSVRLNFISPVAERLLGEVAPFAVDSLGVPRTLSLYVRPEFQRSDPGFDELLLTGPSDMRFDFVQLYQGSTGDFEEAEPDLVALRADGVEVIATAADSLRLSFDAIVPGTGVEVLRLDFNTTLFTGGALLSASLQNQSSGGGWQRVDAGDALEAIESNTTTLVGQEERRILFTDVTVPQPVVTPNGDGINDEALVGFTVLRVIDDSPVEMRLYDVTGRPVRRILEQRSRGSGRYEMGWDGRNDGGDLVPPGIYVARIRLRTDTDGTSLRSSEILRTLSVAF